MNPMQLFKQVADTLWKSGQMEWAPGNWSFSCMLSFDETVASVSSSDPHRFCDVMLNGIQKSTVLGVCWGPRGEEGSEGNTAWQGKSSTVGEELCRSNDIPCPL